MVSALTHYDERYFEYQKEGGQFGGLAELFKFHDFIQPWGKSSPTIPLSILDMAAASC